VRCGPGLNPDQLSRHCRAVARPTHWASSAWMNADGFNMNDRSSQKKETFWNPKVLSPRGILFLALIMIAPLVLAPLFDLIRTVEQYPVPGGTGYRTNRSFEIGVAVIGLLCLMLLLYFRRGIWWLMLIPVLISALTIFKSPNAGAVVTEDQFRWTSGLGNQTIVDLKNIERIVITTDKQYGRYGIRKETDVTFYYVDGQSISVPYSEKSPAGHALPPLFEELASKGIRISRQTTGAAR